ncbi:MULTISPECIES: PucR family transcriptional regulator [Pseudonocardia]|uniref:Purine catabolism regulatory protein-like family protein n=2 Tax=Pseudonocardia TaxID=1847 RepID=A0A1Y2N1D4_PSEAH|nr:MULTISPECIES: PucR family transcriptional regulator [Pseudonocardia]OSY41051.1 Purine catabolism regulatory protein-like family protein [Pseudonocardia autotrophica]TDN73821.1 DNA-binding PucR family transcriptional regulator [Pseudonocardia autotrophica]BBG04568.1 hypothetical protein Pdca_57770 [Pseudonocardia autotrophica]GEC28946.1 hypothetical protein PSA01_59750 [Pseudonocardia saturnea]
MDLDDLLDREEFGLVTVVPGRRRPVLGAHVVEIGRPTRWLPPGWVLLTTGLRLGDPAEYRELVAELSDGDVAALGFGIGIVHDAIPAELVDEADRRGLPLFAVPEATPFREIVRAVDVAVLDRDRDTFRRSAAITDTLTGLLGGPEPQEALVHGLARALRCGAALHRPDGSVLAADPASGRAGAAERWTRFRGLAVTGPPVEVVDADGLFAAAVRPGGELRAWLVAGASRGAAPVPLIVRAVTLVARLLGGLTAAGDDDAARRRRDRAAELSRLVAGDGADAGRTGPAADRDRTVLVLVTGAVLADAERTLDGLRAPYLLGELDGAVVAVVGEGTPSGALPVAGSAVVVAGAPLGPGHRNARLAARRSALTGGGPVRAGDLGVLDRMVIEIGDERAAELTDGLLAPLDPTLLDTVRTWLAHRQDVPATARALHVHENSVRHRLGRVRALVGDLRDPAVLAGIYLALLAEG